MTHSFPTRRSSDLFQDKYMVPALERGLLLLGEFNHRDRQLSAPELARRLKLPRSTVFRLLMTLESMGFVQRAQGGHDYRLGLAVLRSEEHTSELQSLMRISYAVLCLKKKKY